MTIAAGGLPLPIFDFRGAGELARYGGFLRRASSSGSCRARPMSSSPAAFSAHDPRHLYDQPVPHPDLRVEVRAAAQRGRLLRLCADQDEGGAVAAAFLRSARVVMAAAMPFYLGLAATAAPLVRPCSATNGRRRRRSRHPRARNAVLHRQVLLSPACDAPAGPESRRAMARPRRSSRRSRCWSRSGSGYWRSRRAGRRLPRCSPFCGRALPVIGVDRVVDPRRRAARAGRGGDGARRHAGRSGACAGDRTWPPRNSRSERGRGLWRVAAPLRPRAPCRAGRAGRRR